MAGTKFPAFPLLPQDISTYGLDECLHIVLTSEIGDGATGIVHRGTLQLEAYAPLDIVVKLAFSNEQRHALRDEYDVYRRLRLKGVSRRCWVSSMTAREVLAPLRCSIQVFHSLQSRSAFCQSPIGEFRDHNLFTLYAECFFFE